MTYKLPIVKKDFDVQTLAKLKSTSGKHSLTPIYYKD